MRTVRVGAVESLKWLVEMEEEERLRKEKVRQLQEAGINPYPPDVEFTFTPIARIVANPHPGRWVAVAGRIFAIRRHGGLAFVDLYQEGARIQLGLRKNVLGNEIFKSFFKWYDVGDIIEVRGPLFYTKKGDLTIEVRALRLLSKCVKKIPGKYGHSLKNVELRYRLRHLDMMMNPRSFRAFQLRASIIRAMREFLWSQGFMEVETPIIQPVYGGAAAKPFMTKINAIDEQWYLRISPELYLKRFLIAGYDKVFEIGKQFRNEDIDVKHNPEFTSLELYQANADYHDMMHVTESLVVHVVKETLGTLIIKWPKVPQPQSEEEYLEIDFTPPWKRITMKDALKEHANLDVDSLNDADLRALLAEHEIEIPGGYNRGLAIAELFEKLVEDQLIQPTFVMDYPKETTPLCKPHRENPDLIERFELYIAGMELANAYTELNDPFLQKEFFEAELKRHQAGAEETHPYDWDFVEALEYGMPPAGGMGLGVDRLVMLLVGTHSIKEVIPFPIQKRISTQEIKRMEQEELADESE